MTLCTKERTPLLSRIVGCGIPDAPATTARLEIAPYTLSPAKWNSASAECVIPDAPTIELTEYGRCVEKSFIHINENRRDLHINHYVIMPNHVHLLVTIKSANDDDDGTLGNRPLQNDVVSKTDQKENDVNNELALKAIPKLISSLKRYTNKTSQVDLWQNGYYDHIIRDEQDYLIHCKYIVDNPAKWAEDKYYDTF